MQIYQRPFGKCKDIQRELITCNLRLLMSERQQHKLAAEIHDSSRLPCLTRVERICHDNPRDAMKPRVLHLRTIKMGW